MGEERRLEIGRDEYKNGKEVRCRECKWRDREFEWHGDYGCKKNHKPSGLDFWCSDGEWEWVREN